MNSNTADFLTQLAAALDTVLCAAEVRAEQLSGPDAPVDSQVDAIGLDAAIAFLAPLAARLAPRK